MIIPPCPVRFPDELGRQAVEPFVRNGLVVVAPLDPLGRHPADNRPYQFRSQLDPFQDLHDVIGRQVAAFAAKHQKSEKVACRFA
jgi:hypothetical protein